MKFKGARTVLKKEAKFLGMTFVEVMTFIERNPYAVPNRVIEAFSVYKKEMYTNG